MASANRRGRSAATKHSPPTANGNNGTAAHNQVQTLHGSPPWPTTTTATTAIHTPSVKGIHSAKYSRPPITPAATATPSQQSDSPGTASDSRRSHSLRHGAARGTRSSNPDLVHAFEWEALGLQQDKSQTPGASATTLGSSSSIKHSQQQKKHPEVVVLVGPSPSVDKMSRNRPRGPPMARDNGLAVNEETDMWNKILQDLRKAKEKNDKQKALSEQIAALNEKIGKEGGKPSLSEHNQLDSLYRQMLKLCEEERAILVDEPSDVIKNLGLLTALRQASEAEAPINRATSLSKSRKKRNDMDGSATDSPGPSVSISEKATRGKGGTQRSTSVSSSTQDRESRDSRIAVKIEEGVETTSSKGAVAERSGQLSVGAEVVFKHNKNKQGVEGEGIQCIIKAISGDGNKKRYDVQDPEPNENGEQGAVYKTTAASLIPIPQAGTPLPSFASGKQVLARYPDTTTFYRAEVMGSRKDTYRLKFEGEEDDKEMEVDKRFVLDILGK